MSAEYAELFCLCGEKDNRYEVVYINHSGGVTTALVDAESKEKAKEFMEKQSHCHSVTHVYLVLRKVTR